MYRGIVEFEFIERKENQKSEAVKHEGAEALKGRGAQGAERWKQGVERGSSPATPQNLNIIDAFSGKYVSALTVFPKYEIIIKNIH